MSGTTYRAIVILKAAKNTFARYGNENYAIGKANNFLRRCGARLEDGPEQLIDRNVIDQVVFAMLDSESEKVFWKECANKC
jgi:hypothetical protein